MTESESIKICNTIGFATSFSNPQGIPLNTTKDELVEAMRMAIQALEKQISKKVVKEGKWIYKCPCCGECAETDCGDSFYDYQLDYCNGCGQKLDWSDEE